ncbi:copine-9-like [Clavelina lepadiformis]|uniref:copine-9-like n=1 Tax=Clavelina lepadiformis TaxID=159417 RepID=UPI004043210F
MNDVKSVELSIEFLNLQGVAAKNKDNNELSYVIVLYEQILSSNKWKEVHRIKNDPSSRDLIFIEKYVIKHFVKEIQPLKFDVLQNSRQQQSTESLIGTGYCQLGEIFKQKGERLEIDLETQSQADKIIVKAEELSTSKNILNLLWKADNLDTMFSVMRSTKPCMLFYRINEDQTSTVCHKMEGSKGLNPLSSWKFEGKVKMKTLCNNDQHRQLKIEIHGFAKEEENTLIGEFETTVARLLRDDERAKFYKCIHPERRYNKRNQHSGLIEKKRAHIDEVKVFEDYLNSGLQLKFAVAIDFTKSNGDPKKPSSWHYIDPHKPNQYKQVIQVFGKLMENYDVENEFYSYGFGAKVGNPGKISHDFPLNLQSKNPVCFGVHNLIEAYEACVKEVQFHEPTSFSPVIEKIRELALKNPKHYYILLMITDGVITDMQATREIIVKVATLPISIVIVGVGNEDFTNMNELDGDHIRVTHDGYKAVRDIVQFVNLQDYIFGSYNEVISEVRLQDEMMFEVPGQVEAYMEKNGNFANQSSGGDLNTF